jgi:hypothetical protein
MPKPMITPASTLAAAEPRSLPRCLRLHAGEEAQELGELWSMSAAERVAAMWRGELSLYQLCKWSSRAPEEVPLLSGELAWIAIRTPEWQGDIDCQTERR